MGEKNKTIFVYLLVIFLAVFVGTGIFLISNNKKPAVEKEAITTSIIPTEKPTQGSIYLKLSGNERTFLTTDQEFQIDLVADSNGANITGYDLALDYDPLAFDFVQASSDLADFKIYSYKKDNYLSFLATKSLQSQTPSVFAQTKVASLVFKPLKAGKFTFSLKPLMGKDKTDLVTDKTEIFNPRLNELEILVN